MIKSDQWLRSYLFVPGDSERKLAAAEASQADALILDLEDSIALERKAAARSMVAEFLRSAGRERPCFIRMNGYDTGLALKDLCCVLPARPDGIVLPKCSGLDDVLRLDYYLQALEAQHGLAVSSTSMIPIVTETAKSVMALGSYGHHPPRVFGFMWGAEDLSGQIGACRTKNAGAYRGPFAWTREAFLFACHAAGVAAIDAVYIDIKDVTGLQHESAEARIDGFSGKVAIHPSQCPVINESFLPTPEEVAWAEEVRRLLTNSKTGVAVVDGQMVDKPHLARAEKILSSLARRVAAPHQERT